MTTNTNHVQHQMYGGHFKPEVTHYNQNMSAHNHYNPQQQQQQIQQQQQQQQDHQFAPMPINVVMQANTDIDSLLQIHRRKMIRRAANRRSAQQSRARKKALMGDLKIENMRLQKFADILDSQPELTFCVDRNGQITFMSDSASNSMKSTNSDDNDDDPTHLSQILTEESVGTVMDCIAQIRADHISSNSMHGEHDGSGCVSSVQSVCYHDASGYQVAGYIRCSRLIKRAPFDDGTESVAVVDMGPATKKCKTNAQIPLTASNIAAASSSSGPFALAPLPQQQYAAALSINHNGGINGVPEYHDPHHHHIDAEEEFVCAIRPVDASFPHAGGSQLFSSLLSTASIVAHDLDLRSNNDFVYQTTGSSNGLPSITGALSYEPQQQQSHAQSISYPQHSTHDHTITAHTNTNTNAHANTHSNPHTTQNHATHPTHTNHTTHPNAQTNHSNHTSQNTQNTLNAQNTLNTHNTQNTHTNQHGNPLMSYPAPMYAPMSAAPIAAPPRILTDKYLEGVGVQDDQPL